MTNLPDHDCFRFVAELLRTAKSTNQHEQVLHLVTDRVTRLYRCQSCAVILIDPGTEYLSIENSTGLSLTFCNAYRRMIATEAAGRLIWTGTPVLIADARREPELAQELRLEHPFGSAGCVQISVDERPLGYLHAESAEAGAFTAKDLLVLQLFADIAGLAVVKSRMFEEHLRLERVDRETGLDKYLPFLEKLSEGVERSREFHEPCAVALLDIDNFKTIMRTYGYAASRELLREMGDTLRSALRAVDAGGRYGFDEFVVMLCNTDLQGAVDFARELLDRIASRTFTQYGIQTTVSVGVSAYPHNANTVEDLLTTAKRGLFEAQRAGRNRLHYYSTTWYAKEHA
jgi:diguanylate cyclase (GGDEF)-like protein